MRKYAFLLVLFLLFSSFLVTFSQIAPVKAESTIFIRADGSVEGTDKIQRSRDIYMFTSDIANSSLVIKRDSVVIDGQNFSILGNYQSETCIGISLSARNNVTIKNLAVVNFQTGINLENTSKSKVINSDITTNKYESGIRLINSTSNIISNNIVYSDVNYYWPSINGIALETCSNNTISENRVIGSFYKGIYLDRSNNNTILNNSVTKSQYGMDLDLSSNNNLVGNTVFSTVRVISRGVYSDDGTGIWLEDNSTHNQILNNDVKNNGEAMRIWDFSTNNIIYGNNFINNTSQISILTRGEPELRYTPIPNSWDNGTVGNYWSDYLTKYPKATEIEYSGIGDTPYLIDENNIDNFPLMKSVGTSKFHDETSETESFPVPALDIVNKSVYMENGEYITGSFSVSGAKNEDHNKVVFIVNDPDGDEIYEYRIEGPTFDGVSSASFSFMATKSGEYELVFDNTRLRFSEQITVTLAYSVKTLILGLEQEVFYLVIIVIIVVIVILFGVIIRKKIRKNGLE